MLEIHPGVLAKLVSALGREGYSASALAAHISFDAPLTLALLSCGHQSAGQKNTPTSLLLADTLNQLGPEFVRALVLSASPGPAEHFAIWEKAVRVAYLARLIAAHTQVCNDEEAWLAGMAHNLGEYPQFADPDKLSRSLSEIDPTGFIVDAVRFCRASPARVKSAHPLVRVLQLAASLIYSVHVNGNVGVRASLGGLGLDAGEAERLQTEADYLAQEAIHRYSSRDFASAADSLAQAYAALARVSAVQDFLNVATELKSLSRRTVLAMQALFGVNTAVLLQVEGNTLAPVPWWPAPTSLTALSLTTDYLQSSLVRAARGEMVCWHAALADQFPVVDAQVARLLGTDSMLCEPLGLEEQVRYVLIAGNVSQDVAGYPVWKEILQSLATRIPILHGVSTPVTSGGDSIPRQEVRKAVHEASNPLTIIRNYVNLLSTKFATDNDTQRDLAIIGDEIERVAGILHGLGSKQEADQTALDQGTWVDINQVISELVRMSLDTLFLPNKVNVQIDLDPAMGSIVTHRDQLKQVLLNLAKNAVEAMPRGGRLTFASARAEHGGRACAVIAVHDTGPGLPKQVREQMFQPAATTKGGNHAGLGLYISQNLVKSMGGDIECDSSPGGSTFRIYLPMADMGQNQSALQPGGMSK